MSRYFFSRSFNSFSCSKDLGIRSLSRSILLKRVSPRSIFQEVDFPTHSSNRGSASHSVPPSTRQPTVNMTAIFTPALKMIFLRDGSVGCPGATP